jgi:aldose 1-epimerase
MPVPDALALCTAMRSTFGHLPDGRVVDAVLLMSPGGVSARVVALGACLQSLCAPDRDGAVADVVLGYDDVAAYLADANYLGVTIDRYANRIAYGRFTLDGAAYQVERNGGAHALHAGGFDNALWRIQLIDSGAAASVEFALDSPDGACGFPGAVAATVRYSLAVDGALSIGFRATVSRPTILNLTNHATFNLAGEAAGSALDHRLMIAAGGFTPVDAALIPTGEVRAVTGTVFDFTRPRRLAEGLHDSREPQLRHGGGYDHNFVLDKGLSAAPGLAARLTDPGSGRVLEVLTTEPGLQLYSGNFLHGRVPGKGGRLYRPGDGIALEPQKFPDTPNQPAFGSARVDPATPYRHDMVYRLGTDR